MARSGGKTSVWLAADLAAQLDAWETANGAVNLSELLAEAVRRKIGRMDQSEQLVENVATLRTEMVAMQRDMKAAVRRLAKLEKGAR